MKSIDDIQQAHDKLHAIILQEVEVGLSPEELDHAAVSCASLCWVLGCPAGQALENNLAAIDQAAELRGFSLHKSPIPFTGRRPGVG